MAQDFRNNLQRNVGTSPVTLITAGDFDAVIGIRICNVTTSTVLASGDTLEAVSDTASSLDVVLSYIDTISS